MRGRFPKGVDTGRCGDFGKTVIFSGKTATGEGRTRLYAKFQQLFLPEWKIVGGQRRRSIRWLERADGTGENVLAKRRRRQTTVTAVFVKWPGGSGAGARILPGRANPPASGGVGAGARSTAGDGTVTVRAVRGPLPGRRAMGPPGTPPRSAGRAALPYMGIKRTAPRDWSRPGARAGRPRPNAFQTVSAAAAAARDVPLRDRRRRTAVCPCDVSSRRARTRRRLRWWPCMRP